MKDKIISRIDELITMAEAIRSTGDSRNCPEVLAGTLTVACQLFGVGSVQIKQIETEQERMSDYKCSIRGKLTTDADGVIWPHTLSIELHNLSEIPANNVIVKGLLFLNDQQVQCTDIKKSGKVKDDPTNIGITLRNGMYEQIHDRTNRTQAVYTTTYSGMLGESASAYTSKVTVIFQPVENNFAFRDVEIK